MFRQRCSGVLLHITSLPSPYGIGDLGPAARSFVDFLDQAQQRLWQMLPLNLTGPTTGFSPYNAVSAFGGNPLLISPQGLYECGWLDRIDMLRGVGAPVDRVAYGRVHTVKQRLLRRAHARAHGRRAGDDLAHFRARHRAWLDDLCLFLALKGRLGARPWSRWPKALRDRQRSALRQARTELADAIDYHRFCQYVFFQQHAQLHAYARQAGIQLAGDVPIYVAHDSADVWAHPRFFKLGATRLPRFKAGVPPDYFSRTGQLWGNPVYDWDRLRRDDYAWFVARIAHNLELFDLVRLDHFRGLIDYWEVPGGHRSAARGHWAPGPGADLLGVLFRRLPAARLFAEDLGEITPQVRAVMARFGLPGMAVLQFGFGSNPATNEHSPHNITPHTIVYTGTHDNNTTRGWFTQDLTAAQRRAVSEYVGRSIPATRAARTLVRLALQCPARLAVLPLQDLLNLGAEARMNTPARARGNWRWRARPRATTVRLADELAVMTERYGRA